MLNGREVNSYISNMNPTAQAQIVINAPIEKVWAAMMDTSQYAQWNPFIIKVDNLGDVSVAGTDMKLTVRWANGGLQTSNEQIALVKPPFLNGNGDIEAEWHYIFKGPLHTLNLVRGTRIQKLVSLSDSTTQYCTYEEFHGLLKMFVPLSKVQDGFERHAKALKKYLEQ